MMAKIQSRIRQGLKCGGENGREMRLHWVALAAAGGANHSMEQTSGAAHLAPVMAPSYKEIKMNNFKFFFIGFLSILIIGCSAALVPYTSNPEKKLGQSYTLVDLGRPIPAEKLITETLEIYTEQGDELGMAEAYHSFGNLQYSAFNSSEVMKRGLSVEYS